MNAGVQDSWIKSGFMQGWPPENIFIPPNLILFYGLSEMPIPGFILTQFQIKKNTTRFIISLKMFSFIYMGFSRQGLIRSFWEVDLSAGFWLIPNLFLNQKSCIDLIIILKMTWSQISPIDHTCPVALSNQRHLSPSKIHTITPA